MNGIAYGLAAFAIFALHDAVVKMLGGTYDAVQIVFFSVLFGFPLVVLMLVGDTSAKNLRPRYPLWMALRTISVAITGLGAFYAFSKLPLAQTYAILFASPLVITVLSIPILGEQVGVRRWMAVLAGMIGVLVVLRPGQSPLTLGHGAAMFAAIGGALSSIIVRKIGREERNAVLMLYPMLGNIALMGIALPFVYKPMAGQDLALIVVVACLAFAAMLCLIRAYVHSEAVLVAPMQYSQIIWATLYGALFFEEFPDAQTFIGAAIVIASGLYILIRESGGTSSRNRPVLRARGRHETGTYLRLTRKDPPA